METLSSKYWLTFQIHSGIDYGNGLGNTWDERVVISICDGVVIPGNRYANGNNLGGSAQPGRGVSVRCFLDSLDSGRADVDGDGRPDLSNLVVTFNHLRGDVNPAAPTWDIDCSLLNVDGCQNTYTVPVVGDVVRVGTPLGQTGADSFDHLHLSVFFARGFAKPYNNNENNAYYISPILMYSNPIYTLHNFQNYFPYRVTDGRTVFKFERLGIGATCSGYLDCELNRWSGGGFNAYNTDGNGAVYAYSSQYAFWAVQTPTPPPPNHVEWSTDFYPLRPSNDPSLLKEFLEYLADRFPLGTTYQGPECTFATDTQRIPFREVAICDPQSDLDDDSIWTVSPHSN